MADNIVAILKLRTCQFTSYSPINQFTEHHSLPDLSKVLHIFPNLSPKKMAGTGLLSFHFFFQQCRTPNMILPSDNHPIWYFVFCSILTNIFTAPEKTTKANWITRLYLKVQNSKTPSPHTPLFLQFFRVEFSDI